MGYLVAGDALIYQTLVTGGLLRTHAINAATPPSRISALITRNRLMTHAIPIPNAGHFTHQ